MRALVVDDERQVLTLLDKYLSMDGFEVVTTTDGAKAVEKASRETFDVILLDVMMPEINGFSVCEKIRKSSMNMNVPIVFVTARSDPFGAPTSFKSGGTAYLTKPFTRRQLMSLVHSVLPCRKTGHEKKARDPDKTTLKIAVDEILKKMSVET
jgi:two-component system alkaline phosphatase synthesis response regulator PhoP